jgi:hypothetical protein
MLLFDQLICCCFMQELVAHPFWKTRLPLMELPSEPALEEFIRRHNLAPAGPNASDKVSG